MLTAQNKQTPIDADLSSSSTSTIGGFGKVLNSIQGLQQRLSDFSIEDVTSAEDKASTRIRRLALLQNKLDRLANLKHSLADAEDMIRQIPEPDYDLIGPASLEKHPQLHAIVKANKVIRLHRLLKIAKASAESVSFDPEVGRLDVTSPLAPAITPTKEQKYPEPVAKTEPEAKADKHATARQAGKESPSEVIELPPPPTPTSIETETSLGLASDETEPIGAVEDNAPSLAHVELEPTQYAYSEASTPIVPTYTPQEATAAIVPPEPFPVGETKVEIHATEAAVEQLTPALERNQDLQTPTPPRTHRSQSNVVTSTTAPEFNDERASTSIDSVFDQRLLEELIQNYGEFAPFAEPSASHLETPKPGANVATPRIAASTAPIEAPLRPEPKFVAPEPMAVVEATAVESVEVSVPSVRSNGDLDRQLKKIIKDYGEYDLYSHSPHSSVTLKKSGIAAFIVLALVLSGVYFLRARAKSTPTQVNSVLPTKQVSSPAVPQAAKENAADESAASELNRKTDGNEKTPRAAKTKTKQK
jgi:hypothetical protein